MAEQVRRLGQTERLLEIVNLSPHGTIPDHEEPRRRNPVQNRPAPSEKDVGSLQGPQDADRPPHGDSGGKPELPPNTAPIHGCRIKSRQIDPGWHDVHPFRRHPRLGYQSGGAGGARHHDGIGQ